MKIFENTPVYIVYYWPGTSGTFIQSLLSMFEQEGVVSFLSEHGNAHANNSVRNNTRITDILENQSQYLMVEPIDPSKPLFIGEHFPLDYDTLYRKFPKAKIIMIQYSVDDVELVEANLFYKVYVDSYDNNTQIKKQWDDIKDVFFEGIENPRLVPDNIVQRFISSNKTVCPYFSEKFSVPDKVVRINFRDILLNRDTILQMLSDLTNKPTTESIVSFYNNYLEKQYQMCSKINFDLNGQTNRN